MKTNVTVSPLYEGTFSVGLDKKFNRIGREDPPEKGALKLSINPFLIRDENRNLLFDTGIGDLFGNDTTIRTLLGNLENHSVADYEITDIFLSHLHFDHMGGLAHRSNGYLELTFPDAAIWVSGGGWEKLRSSIGKETEEKQDLFNFLDAKAQIEKIREDSSPVPHVRVKQIGGHTEHHLALFYENGSSRYLMAGDVIGRRIAINRNFTAKYDYAPKQSMKAREELKKLAYEKKYIIMAYHETDSPLFRLTAHTSGKGYTVKPLQ